MDDRSFQLEVVVLAVEGALVVRPLTGTWEDAPKFERTLSDTKAHPMGLGAP